MMRLGFERVAAVVAEVRVADPESNGRHIAALVREAAGRGVRVAVFPELSLTGCTCGDLFGQELLLRGAEEALAELVAATAECPVVAAVGMPVRYGDRLFDCAVVFSAGKIYGAVPGSRFAAGGSRRFASGEGVAGGCVGLCGCAVPFGRDLLFRSGRLRFGVEIGNDWRMPVPLSAGQVAAGADLILCLAADSETAGGYDRLQASLAEHSLRMRAACVYASAGYGESSTDRVFAGRGAIVECGDRLAEAERFSLTGSMAVCEIDTGRIAFQREKTGGGAAGSSEKFRTVEIPFAEPEAAAPFLRGFDPHPFLPAAEQAAERYEEILEIQTFGLVRRLDHIGLKRVVLGISGGLDSTLALMVCVRAFERLGVDRSGIVAVTMPGFGTSDRTYANALGLMRALGVTRREIGIREACLRHFDDLGYDPAERGATYENAQARERTQILMDEANRIGALVVGTGDLSELALGWATYNGDHMSMYGVNGGVPKTLVRALVDYLARCGRYPEAAAYLADVVATPVSPELLPPDGEEGRMQSTEQTVGPYDLHDFFFYHLIGGGCRPAKVAFMAASAFRGVYDEATVRHWSNVFVRRFFSQQFKRSALPDGPQVCELSLSPRGGWDMPSDALSGLWQRDVEWSE